MSAERTGAEPAAKGATRMPPIVTPDAREFWAAADRGEFIGQKCGDCGRFTFPPRPMCPHCHSLQREYVALSGRGTVVSYTIPRHPQPFGFAKAPVVAVVELEEGIRMVSNVVGVKPEAMQMDLPVEVTFEPTLKGHQVPVFRPRAK